MNLLLIGSKFMEDRIKEQINKKELDKLLEVKGNVRGVVFQTDAKYILKSQGKEGLARLQEKAKELGYPIDYYHSKAMQWYPIGLRVISLVLIKNFFHLTDGQIKEMGLEAPKISFIIKLLARFFVNAARTIKGSPKFWREHYSVGELKIISIDMGKYQFVIRLVGLSVHPVFCKYLEGFFQRIAIFGIRPGMNCTETKCTFRGDPYHEYYFSWQKKKKI